MATDFRGWVAHHRKNLGWSQAQVAREVTRRLGREFTRDQAWKLERGMPENPSPGLVAAIAEALGRPLAEALDALGYELPPPHQDSRLDPALVEVLRGLPLQSQRQLALALPSLLALLEGVRSPPELARVAEPREGYAGRRPARKRQAAEG